MNRKPISPVALPLSLMAKPAGARCNLSCSYCYYLDKLGMYGSGASATMSDETLEAYIAQYIAASADEEVTFVWHGGEPLLRPLAFYERVVELQRRYADGHRIANSLQTNGTLLTDTWAQWLHEHGWLVGVSIDGPAPLHDAMRRTHGGGATHAQVMRGIELLQRHGVDWNAMAVVNRLNADHPVECYRFFKAIGCQYLQFTPIVELDHPADNVQPEQWGRFCIGLYEEWIREDVGKIFVQLFDATLAGWMGVTPGVCTLGQHCGHALVVEWNGDVYPCDHFVRPELRLGNIHREGLVAMATSETNRRFGRQKMEGLSPQCLACRWLHLCHGECPKNRVSGASYLCAGYRAFFDHVAPDMAQMAAELEHAIR